MDAALLSASSITHRSHVAVATVAELRSSALPQRATPTSAPASAAEAKSEPAAAHASLSSSSRASELAEGAARCSGSDASAAHAAALVAAADRKLDMFAPLVPQVGALTRDEYCAWVHAPFYYTAERMREHSCTPACAHACAAYAGRDRAARLFASDALEALSFTSPSVVPLVWLPVALALVLPLALSPSGGVAALAACAAVGAGAWSLVEYAVHRFVFHADEALPDSSVARTLHFIIHGVHHKVPHDALRLVLPPALFSLLAAPLYAALRPLFTLVVALDAFHAMFGAGIAAYVAYDMMHYAQHHVRVTRDAEALWPHLAAFAALKRYHMKHHFAGAHHSAFGITSALWDVIFGTLPAAHLQ